MNLGAERRILAYRKQKQVDRNQQKQSRMMALAEKEEEQRIELDIEVGKRRRRSGAADEEHLLRIMEAPENPQEKKNVLSPSMRLISDGEKF